MCTVVCRWAPPEPVQILAVRDELVSRDFDPPDEWWPAQPGVVGGRDQQAGGSWCVSDVASGVTALVLNRVERRTGTPSRGVLPLAAVSAGQSWPQRVAHRDMAAFNLVLADPAGLTVWTWDAETLTKAELAPGVHMITSSGVDTDDAKTTAFAPRFTSEAWIDVITSCEPVDDPRALVVRHPIDEDVYATVLAQLITAEPGALQISYSRTPWVAASWTADVWP
ncbi:MAG: NRDE family protein [Jatrophihabitans sp.]|uniref:NRDE family protein n=1 Tax=Jatrophihabitans sp. TaxID=1932789 RepID=UPI003910789E